MISNSDVFLKGKLAYWERKSLEDNPYREGCKESQGWILGWYQGLREKEGD